MVGNEDGSGSRLELVKDGFLKPTLRVVLIVGVLGFLQFVTQFVPGATEPLFSRTVTIGITVYTVLTVGIFAAVVDYTTHVGESLADLSHGFPAVERICQLVGVFVVLVWGYLVFGWLPYFRANRSAYTLLFLGLGLVWVVWMGYLLATNVRNIVSMVTGTVGSVLGSDAGAEGGADDRSSAGGARATDRAGHERDSGPRPPSSPAGDDEQIPCPACGDTLPVDAESCPSCGAALSTGGAGDAGRSGTGRSRDPDRGRRDRGAGEREEARRERRREDTTRGTREGRRGRSDSGSAGSRREEGARGERSERRRDAGGTRGSSRGDRTERGRTGRELGDSDPAGRDQADTRGAGDRSAGSGGRGRDLADTGREPPAETDDGSSVGEDDEPTFGDDGATFDDDEEDDA